MKDKIKVQSILAAYKVIHPNENLILQKLDKFLIDTNDNNLYDRKNFIGHITASAMIIDVKDSKILVIHHKALDRLLQPGGHVELEDESIFRASLREVKEETNLDKINLRTLSPSFDYDIPFDIDSHIIPANNKKNEPQHYHHDFKYLFIYNGDTKILVNHLDATNFEWLTFDKLEHEIIFKRPIEKIRRLLSSEFREKIFFENIISKVQLENKIYKCVVVSHILPGSEVFHQALNKIFPIITIIPKPKSIDEQIYNETKKQFRLTHITKQELSSNKNAIIDLLKVEQGNLILFDIGGYFSEISLHWPQEIIERITLIVEDTENGHQKYEQQLLQSKVLSVARSPLKDNEDFLVGQSVLFSADSLLREQATLIQYKKCSVFGYGKIGKSIAIHLVQRGIKPMVYDTNPILRVEAFNRLNSIPSRESIIKSSDVIFSATGNRSLNIHDFRQLKNGCYIFSVTSSDDEMDLNFLNEEYSQVKGGKYITKYYNDINNFYLVNDGNAVNFIHNAIMGNFIHLVRSEMILAINELNNFDIGKINFITQNLRKEITQIWLNTFDPESKNLEFIL